jgi:hypothetical protein
MKKLFGVLTVIALASTNLYSEDEDIFNMNEDEMFSDTSVMRDSASVVKSASSLGNVDSTTASFSGQITSAVGGTLSDDFFGDPNKDGVDPLALTVGDLILDVRLPLGVKGYANTEFTWLADSSKAFMQLQECFVDVNIAKKAYFRIGKQVLQWGRGEVWNPTDLINIEKKPFQKDLGAREGSYGIKMHIPFGTKWNIYGFVDLNDVTAVDSVAATMKLEGLFGGTEAAIALWKKPSKDPVVGIDFSTSLLDFSITGEVSLTSGNNYYIPDRFEAGKSLKMKTLDKDVVARLCIGASRFIDLLGVDDRMIVHGEYYYNQAGFDGNKIKEYGIGDLLGDIKKGDFGSGMDNLEMQRILWNQIAAIYEPNNHSRHYASLSASISKFIISEITLSCKGVVNMNHGSGMIVTGLSYYNMYNYFLGLEVTTNVGSQNTEYNFMGNRMSVNLYTGIAF